MEYCITSAKIKNYTMEWYGMKLESIWTIPWTIPPGFHGLFHLDSIWNSPWNDDIIEFIRTFRTLHAIEIVSYSTNFIFTYFDLIATKNNYISSSSSSSSSENS